MSIPGIRAHARALGAHIAKVRKSIGLTQAELARVIGVSQQAVFAYELGERRVPVLALVNMAKEFGMSVDELVGMRRPIRPSRDAVPARVLRHAERLNALPKPQQRFVLKILDSLED